VPTLPTADSTQVRVGVGLKGQGWVSTTSAVASWSMSALRAPGMARLVCLSCRCVATDSRPGAVHFSSSDFHCVRLASSDTQSVTVQGSG
jgi:hypothetical protein